MSGKENGTGQGEGWQASDIGEAPRAKKLEPPTLTMPLIVAMLCAVRDIRDTGKWGPAFRDFRPHFRLAPSHTSLGVPLDRLPPKICVNDDARMLVSFFCELGMRRLGQVPSYLQLVAVLDAEGADFAVVERAETLEELGIELAYAGHG